MTGEEETNPAYHLRCRGRENRRNAPLDHTRDHFLNIPFQPEGVVRTDDVVSITRRVDLVP